MSHTSRDRRRGWLAAALAGAAAGCLGLGAHLLTEPARADVADAGTLPSDSTPSDSTPSDSTPSDSTPSDSTPFPSTPFPSMQGDGLPAPAAAAVQEAPRHVTRTGAAPVPELPPLVLPPAGFRSPALHLRAPVVPVGTDRTGALDLPGDTGTLGWWAGGALPGSTRGTVVLAGHIDTLQDGPGVMAAVLRQPLGATLQVVDAAGRTTSYRVVAVRSYPKTALPASVFTGSGRPRLVLVTCGGAFDEARHHYSDNVVVYAVPA